MLCVRATALAPHQSHHATYSCSASRKRQTRYTNKRNAIKDRVQMVAQCEQMGKEGIFFSVSLVHILSRFSLLSKRSSTRFLLEGSSTPSKQLPGFPFHTGWQEWHHAYAYGEYIALSLARLLLRRCHSIPLAVQKMSESLRINSYQLWSLQRLAVSCKSR